MVQRAIFLFFGMAGSHYKCRAVVKRACALFFGILSMVMFMFIFSAELLLEYLCINVYFQVLQTGSHLCKEMT